MLEHHVPRDASQASGEANRDAGSFPLTAAQLGIWIDCAIDPSHTNYNISEYLEICGEIDPLAFRSALERVVEEVETFHVEFVSDGDEMRQVRRRITDWPFTLLDLTTDPTPRARAEKWIEDYVADPVDPLSGSLFAFALLKVASDKWFWLVRYHHLIVDGFSGGMIARRVAEVYNAIVAGKDAGVSPFGTLADSLEEENQYRQSDHFRRDQSYWTERIANSPPAISLSKREPARSDRFIRQTAQLKIDDADALRALAKALGTTLPQLIATATAIYLHGMTGEEDMVIGYSVTGRFGARAASLVGMLTNILPIRISLHATTPLADLTPAYGTLDA